MSVAFFFLLYLAAFQLAQSKLHS